MDLGLLVRLYAFKASSFKTLKARHTLSTQFHDPISCFGKPVKRTNEIKKTSDFIVPLHWFPVESDRIVGLSLTVDQVC